MTTTDLHSACNEKLCTSCVRQDHTKADERLLIDKRLPKEDLVNRYRKGEKITDAVADMVMGLFGYGSDDQNAFTNAMDLHLLGPGSKS